MGLATVFKVFKGSLLVTPQGEIKISRIFPDRHSARKAHYHFLALDRGIYIYCRRTGSGRIIYAYVGD
jgi:hypothetical protein